MNSGMGLGFGLKVEWEDKIWERFDLENGICKHPPPLSRHYPNDTLFNDNSQTSYGISMFPVSF